MKLFVATHNQHKIREIGQILPDIEIISDDPEGVEESAPDFAGNALIKVRAEYPVDAETPPAFVAQAKDDFCQIETSTGYFHALEAAGVKNCRLEVMASGNHGYGLRKLGRATDAWSDRAAAWLKDLLK